MSRKKTQDEFVKEISVKNPKIEVLGEYVNNRTKILCRCREFGHEWKPIPTKKLRDQGCPYYADNIKKSQEDFVKEIKSINPNIEILSKYVNVKEKIDCKCKICDYTWSSYPSNLLKGKGCQRCAGNIKKTNEQFIEELKIKQPNIETLESYENSTTEIQCRCKICNYIWKATPKNLLKGKGCPSCAGNNKKTYEEFIEQLRTINPNIEVLEDYKNNHTKILCKCKKCNYEWKIRPSSLLRNQGCPKCAGNAKRTQDNFIEEVSNINPNIKVIGKYINKQTKVLCSCKLCNSQFYITPNRIFKHQISSCPVCSDGISYPNKFVRNFLNQLPIENLIYEWKIEKNKQYSYDNYFIYNNKEYIVEADGAQHFQKNKFNYWEPEEIQRRDRIKDKLAKDNNIIMIRIDCQKSEPNYIRQSIENSELYKIFDLSNINWEECHIRSINSLVKQVCDLYNEGYKNVNISTKLKLNPTTITRYLKKGQELGWCNYIAKNKKVS